jgi:hypothetical protein
MVVGAAAIAVGALLALIGMRFLLAPDLAARQFGVATVSTDAALHRAIGLRDIWLGLVAIGLALWRWWPGLALWFAAGTVVCLGDAVLVLASSGSAWAVAFHLAAGALFAGVALGSWRLSR